MICGRQPKEYLYQIAEENVNFSLSILHGNKLYVQPKFTKVESYPINLHLLLQFNKRTSLKFLTTHVIDGGTCRLMFIIIIPHDFYKCSGSCVQLVLHCAVVARVHQSNHILYTLHCSVPHTAIIVLLSMSYTRAVILASCFEIVYNVHCF